MQPATLSNIAQPIHYTRGSSVLLFLDDVIKHDIPRLSHDIPDAHAPNLWMVTTVWCPAHIG